MKPKPLKMDSDGRLALSERDVERAICDFLRLEGWLVIETKAENLRRNGAPAHARGTLDAMAVLPPRPWPGMIRPITVIFLEFKRRNARTGKKHLAEQSAMAAWLREKGFLVYRTPEAYTGNVVSHFMEFYQEQIKACIAAAPKSGGAE